MEVAEHNGQPSMEADFCPCSAVGARWASWPWPRLLLRGQRLKIAGGVISVYGYYFFFGIQRIPFVATKEQGFKEMETALDGSLLVRRVACEGPGCNNFRTEE